MARSINFGTSSQQDEAAKRYAGTQYEDLVNSNPYENQDYHQSVLDRFGNFFGFRTKEDKRKEDLALRSSEFLSQVDSLAREEEYNSEFEKMLRLRKAGVNTDLQGIDSASQASEFTEPESTPEAPSSDGDNVTSIFSSVLSSAQDVVSIFLAFQQAGLVNTGIALDNAGKVMGLATDADSQFALPETDISSDDLNGDLSSDVLPASVKQSGREWDIATAIFGNPKRRSSLRAKAEFWRALRSKRGTLSSAVERNNLQSSANVSSAILRHGEGSSSFVDSYVSFVSEIKLLEAEYDSKMAAINAKWINKEGTSDMIEQGLDQSVIESAQTDGHMAAVASNAGYSAGVANANAEIAEASARTREAEEAELQAEYRQKVFDAYESWFNEAGFKRNGKLTRKGRRHAERWMNLGPANESWIPLSGSASYSAGSRTSSSNVVKRVIK